MLLGREKVSFLDLPTPLHFLPNLSSELGINLYIKRDDMTCLGVGGNKLRKLEYFLWDAQDKGATMLLTTGGVQTNHGRLTAAVAAKYNMKAAIYAIDEYPGQITANLLLDSIMGCPMYLFPADPDKTSAQVSDEARQKVTEIWEEKGEKVYFIPMGGSNEIGALGYYNCGLELNDQIREMEIENPRLVTTVGSMGTYMGLAAALANENLNYRLTGVGIMPYHNGLKNHAVKMYDRMKEFYGLHASLYEDNFDLTDKYDYGGYNNPVEDVRKAIYLMARKEAILLDPCYTGKTFNGLLKMVESGQIKKGENVIFLHTGGLPGIYTEHHRIEIEKELGNYINIME